MRSSFSVHPAHPKSSSASLRTRGRPTAFSSLPRSVPGRYVSARWSRRLIHLCRSTLWDGPTLAQDVRYAVRTLRRSPGFAVAAVLTLALGIGATTAIYSVVDTILLQPLPFADADGLVQIAENVPSSVPGRPPFQRGVTYQEFLEWRARSTTLADAFAVSMGENVVRTSEGTARLWGATVSANTFTVLGAGAMLGRTLVAGDDANPNVVVLSFDTWRRLFRLASRTPSERRSNSGRTSTPA